MRGLGSPLAAAAAAAAASLVVAAPVAAAVSSARASDATRQIVLVARGRSVTAMRYDGPYLTWATTGGEDNPVSGVFERNGRTGRVTKLASDVLSELGIASDRKWVVYARVVGRKQQLVAVSRNNRVRRVLTNSLIAPIDVRGSRLAWVEAAGRRQRIVVEKIDGGARWVASSLPRCSRGRCYRIDAVTLADNGIVFDRAAIGANRSQIVRRAFGARRATSITLADPQPDLRRSARGAFYYYVQHGWYRWDFGARRPVRVPLKGGSTQNVAALEGGRILIITGGRCQQTLTIASADGRTRRLGGPRAPKIVPTYGGSVCRQLTAVGSSSGKTLIGWSFLPLADLEAHIEEDLVGVITAERF